MDMKHFATILLGLLMAVACQTTPTTYEEPDSEPPEEEPTYVSVSVASFRVTHVDGTPYISASGKVKNQGPKNVRNVRVWISSNYGDTKVVVPTPYNLAVGEIGSWQVSRLEGSSIRDKNVTFDEE